MQLSTSWQLALPPLVRLHRSPPQPLAFDCSALRFSWKLSQFYVALIRGWERTHDYVAVPPDLQLCQVLIEFMKSRLYSAFQKLLRSPWNEISSPPPFPVLFSFSSLLPQRYSTLLMWFSSPWIHEPLWHGPGPAMRSCLTAIGLAWPTYARGSGLLWTICQGILVDKIKEKSLFCCGPNPVEHSSPGCENCSLSYGLPEEY